MGSKQNLVLLRTYLTRAEAQIIASHLESVNIETKIIADDCGGVYPFSGDVKLLVNESQKELAEEYLSADVEILDED